MGRSMFQSNMLLRNARGPKFAHCLILIRLVFQLLLILVSSRRMVSDAHIRTQIIVEWVRSDKRNPFLYKRKTMSIIPFVFSCALLMIAKLHAFTLPVSSGKTKLVDRLRDLGLATRF